MERITLTESEEITLRRINCGIARTSELIARDIARLIELSLIERQGGRVALSEAGRRLGDPRATLRPSSNVPAS